MSFGERLKALRQEKDLTQAKLGKLINISPRMISFYESNLHFPKDATILITLADYFDVSLDYLLGKTNTRDYNKLLQSFNRYDQLPDQGKLLLDEYLEFLSLKYSK